MRGAAPASSTPNSLRKNQGAFAPCKQGRSVPGETVSVISSSARPPRLTPAHCRVAVEAALAKIGVLIFGGVTLAI